MDLDDELLICGNKLINLLNASDDLVDVPMEEAVKLMIEFVELFKRYDG